MSRARFWGLTAVLIAWSSVARADVAYSNFGPGMAYSGAGWSISGPTSANAGLALSPQGEFTAGVSGTLADLVVAVSHDSGTNSGTVAVYTDSAGSPGAVL